MAAPKWSSQGGARMVDRKGPFLLESGQLGGSSHPSRGHLRLSVWPIRLLPYIG